MPLGEGIALIWAEHHRHGRQGIGTQHRRIGHRDYRQRVLIEARPYAVGFRIEIPLAMLARTVLLYMAASHTPLESPYSFGLDG